MKGIKLNAKWSNKIEKLANHVDADVLERWHEYGKGLYDPSLIKTEEGVLK